MSTLQFAMTLFAGLFWTLLSAQDVVDPPPPCGATEGLLPVTVLPSKTGGPARLRFANSNVELDVPGVMSEFGQACPISRERILTFGVAGEVPLYNISIIDVTNSALLDQND